MTTRPSLIRLLFAMAGSVVLAGASLAALVSPWFLLLVGFVALNLWLFAAAGECPASLVLCRLARLEGCRR